MEGKTMSEELTYALLIDAENISSKYIKIILDELSNYGVATYRRIYGDWTNPANSAWKDVLLNYSVNPVQQYTYTQGKNASDSAMIIDAMDILYSGNVGGFCLVTSDSDFTRLASRLRESGKRVIGMGESKTPSAFISACNQFKYLDILFASSEEEKEKEKERKEVEQKEANKVLPTRTSRKKSMPPRATRNQNEKTVYSKTQSQNKAPVVEKSTEKKEQYSRPEPQTKINTIRKSLRAIISEGSNEDGWISASKIGNQLAKRFPDFDVRNYGYSKLNQFIESLGDFEMDVITPSKNSKVQHIYFRLKEKPNQRN